MATRGLTFLAHTEEEEVASVPGQTPETAVQYSDRQTDIVAQMMSHGKPLPLISQPGDGRQGACQRGKEGNGGGGTQSRIGILTHLSPPN